jgi:hypothetical protein
MRTIDLFAHRAANEFVQGVNAANVAAPLTIAQNDTLQLVIHNVERNTAIPALTPFVERPLDFTSIRASIGKIDAAPTGGSFKLRVDGETTAALTWPTDLSTTALITAWKTTVLTALKALSTVGSTGVELLDDSTTPAHFFFFRWTNVSNTDEIEVVENKLSPWSDALVIPSADATGGLTQLVKLVQFPARIATDFERPTSPVATITETREGEVGTNAEQTLYVPSLATGSLSLVWDGVSTKTIAVGAVTATALASALNAIVADGATTPAFRVEERAAASDGRRFAIEFIGPLAGAAQSMLTISMHDQASLPWAVGILDLAGNVPIERYLSGEESVELSLEIVITTADGEETFLRTVTVQNDMTGPGTVASAEAAGAVVTIVREVNVDDGLGTPFAEFAKGISFTLPLDAATNEFTFTHSLNDWQPRVYGFYKASTSPEEWTAIPDDQFEARSTSVNVTKITLPFDVDITTSSAETYATRYKFFFAANEQQIDLFEHQHEWAEILETVPGGQDLATKLAAIDAAISGLGGGVAIPGAALNDGSVAPAKLDLTALATALFGNAEFLRLLRLFAKDDTFIENLIAQLTTSDTLVEARETLLTQLLEDATTNETLQTALLDVLKNTSGFSTFIYEQILSALAGGAQPPAFVLVLPDVDLLLPPSTTITLGGKETRLFRGLPIAYQTTTDGGNVSGTLSAGTAGYRYATTAVSIAPETEARGAQRFPSGVTLVWNGEFYQQSTNVTGTAYYPSEFEMVLIEAFMDDARMPAASLLTLTATVQTQLLSDPAIRLRARWRLVIEVGTPTAESGELNLNAFTWQTGVTHTLQLGSELAITPVVITASRPASGSVTWAVKINGTSAAFTLGTAVTSGNFAIRARLTQFDPQNATAPRGAVLLKCLKPGGKISALE